MRLDADLIGIGLIVLFGLSVAAAGANPGTTVLGVKVTPVVSEPDKNIEPPPIVSTDEPTAPQISEDDQQTLFEMEDIATGSIATTYQVTRTYGSAYVKLTFMNRIAYETSGRKSTATPSASEQLRLGGVWIFETSYGCSLLRGASGNVVLHGKTYDFVYYPCKTNNILPPAPLGFARWKWWELIEQDAYYEIWQERFSVAEQYMISKEDYYCKQDPEHVCSLIRWYKTHPRDREGYQSYIRAQYTEYATDYRGTTYNEETVKASCGGVWLPWAAPFGCAILIVPYATVVSVIDPEDPKIPHLMEKVVTDPNKAKEYVVWSAKTDMIGLVSEKLPIRALHPPPNGAKDYCGPYGGPAAYAKLPRAEGEEYWLETCGPVHPLMNEVKWWCEGGNQLTYWSNDLNTDAGYDYADGCPADWVNNIDYWKVVKETPRHALTIQTIQPVTAILMVKCGSYGEVHDSLAPKCQPEGWDAVQSYMDKLPLIDKVLFMEYIAEHEAYRYSAQENRRCAYADAVCPLPSMSGLMSRFDQYLASGDKAAISYGTQEKYAGYTNEANPFGSWEGHVCPLLKAKEVSAKLLAGEIDRNAPENECNEITGKLSASQKLPDLTKGFYGECEQIKDSSGNVVAIDCSSLRERALIPRIVLPQGFFFTVENIAVLDVNDWWIAVWVLAAVLIVIGLYRRLRESDRIG